MTCKAPRLLLDPEDDLDVDVNADVLETREDKIDWERAFIVSVVV